MLTQKTFRPFLTLVFLFFCCVLTSLAIGQRRGEKIEGKPPKLEIGLELFKTKYLLREPIWARFKVTNVGSEAGKFYFDNVDALVIKDSKGEVYPCSVYIERFAITIKPEQTLEKQSNILQYYGTPENKFKIHRYLPPEKYSVYYELNHCVGSDSYRVKAKSKTHTFEISDPKGDELKAMNLLKESHDLFIEKKYNEAISALNKIIEHYPKSVYAPYALLEVSSIYNLALEDSAKALEIYRRLINDFPNSGEAIARLSSLIYYYKTKPDKPGLITYLNDLIKKHPDTEVAKEAQKELAKLKE